MASHPQIQPRTSPMPGTRTGVEADPRTGSKPGTWTSSRGRHRTRGFGGGNDEFGVTGTGSERVGSWAGSAVGPRSGSKTGSGAAEEAEAAAKSPRSGSRAGSGAGSASAVGDGGRGGGWEWHADRVEAGFTALNAVGWSGLPKTELVEVMAKLTSFNASSDGLLCALTAALSSIEGKADAAETLRQQSHMSLHDARRFERVGSQLADMPNTSQQLSSGEITLDHATEMAKAAELVGAAAVDSDDTLLESAGSLVAERFAQQVKTWTRDRLYDRGADLHQTQRHRRRGLLFVDKSNGMGVLHTEFDEIAFGLIRQAVDTRAQAMLNFNTTQAANGLDGPVSSGPAANPHPRRGPGTDLRTNSSTGSSPAANTSPGSGSAADGRAGVQGPRLAAANGLAGSGPAANPHPRRAHSADLRANSMVGSSSAAGGSAGVGGTRTRWDSEHDNAQRQVRNLTQCRADAVFELVTGRSADTPHPPLTGESARAVTQLLIVADIGVIDGTNPAGRCEIIGTGAVPPTILTQLSPDTKLAAMIFDDQGQPLWLGRSRRHHNTHQYLATAARDAGCVECRAPMHVCDIHHTKPWSQGGPTDIENLEALCGHHHRQTHTTNPTSPSPDTYQQPVLC